MKSPITKNISPIPHALCTLLTLKLLPTLWSIVNAIHINSNQESKKSIADEILRIAEVCSKSHILENESNLQWKLIRHPRGDSNCDELPGVASVLERKFKNYESSDDEVTCFYCIHFNKLRIFFGMNTYSNIRSWKIKNRLISQNEKEQTIISKSQNF